MTFWSLETLSYACFHPGFLYVVNMPQGYSGFMA